MTKYPTTRFHRFLSSPFKDSSVYTIVAKFSDPASKSVQAVWYLAYKLLYEKAHPDKALGGRAAVPSNFTGVRDSIFDLNLNNGRISIKSSYRGFADFLEEGGYFISIFYDYTKLSTFANRFWFTTMVWVKVGSFTAFFISDFSPSNLRIFPESFEARIFLGL